MSSCAQCSICFKGRVQWAGHVLLPNALETRHACSVPQTQIPSGKQRECWERILSRDNKNVCVCFFFTDILLYFLIGVLHQVYTYPIKKKISFRVIPQAQVAYVNKIQNSIYTGKNIQNNINNILRCFLPPFKGGYHVRTKSWHSHFMLLFENIQISDLRKEGHLCDLTRPTSEHPFMSNIHHSVTLWK